MIAVNTTYQYAGLTLRVTGALDVSVPTWRDVAITDADSGREVPLPDHHLLLALDRLSQAAGVSHLA